MNSSPKQLHSPILQQVVSTMLIAAYLAFAGLMGTWLFSREWQEKAIAAGSMGLPLLLAWAQYQATFRANRASAKVAAILSALLAVLATLFCLISWSMILRFAHPLTNALVYTFVAAVLVLVSYGNLTWLDKLAWAAQEDRLPVSPRKISLKEIFLLIAAAALMLGVTSYCVQRGFQNKLLF